jgi:predicted Kef-type K+ transport protein
LGGLQVLISAAAIAGIGFATGLVWQVSLAVGLSLALSSTAIVLQSLKEKGLIRTEGGQSAFSVLLLQDIAVIPMLAVLPMLAMAQSEKTQVIDLDEASVIGEIEDPFIFGVFEKRTALIEDIENLQKSFLDEIKVIDKEAFELDLKR